MNKAGAPKILIGLTLLLVNLVVLFLNYFPHYYGLLKTPENFFYSGQASWFDPWDINNYFAVIRWAQEKRGLLLENFNTTELHKKALIYPLYIIAGNLFPNINHFILFHALATIGGLLLCCSIFISSYLILKNVVHSLVALILISLGGGLGWLFSSSGQSADINIPGITFFSSFQKPHEAVVAILYIFSLVFYFLSVKQRSHILNLCSLVSLLLLIPFYPYRLLNYFLICGLFALVYSHKKRDYHALSSLGLNLFIALPVGFLYLLHFMSSGFSVLTLYKPQPLSFFSLILGYGLFLLIFIYQFFHINLKDEMKVFLNIWFLASIGLSLLPIGMSRLFLSTLLFPLVLINLLSLKDISKNFQLNSRLIILMLLILTPLSSFYIFNKRMKEGGRTNVWFYLPLEIKGGFEFLENRKETGVLALPLIESYVPAHTGKSVYCGHQDQTPGFQEKLINTINFYSGKFSAVEAERFLRENNINFVVYSDEEKQLGQLKYPFLKSVYKNDRIEIFEEPTSAGPIY